MRPSLATSVLIVTSALWGVAQNPTLPIPSAGNSLHIIHGPVVENVTDTTAIIAWSTNVNAGTLLRYGTGPDRLDQTAGMPWGGLTHRVDLHGLQPETKYFFRAESPHGQGTGEDAQSAVLSFQTKPTNNIEH
jgi:hypothetical protein